jgi:hypothetical protein
MGKPETSVCRGDGSAPKSCFVRKLTDPQPKSTLLSNSGDAVTLIMISTVPTENRPLSAALKPRPIYFQINGSGLYYGARSRLVNGWQIVRDRWPAQPVNAGGRFVDRVAAKVLSYG